MGVVLSAHFPTARVGSHSRDANLLNAAEERALSRIGVFQIYPDTEMLIFSQGEEAKFFYIVQTGIVRISREAVDGSRQVIGFRLAGDPIGLAVDSNYVNSGHTLTAVTLYRFSIARFRQLMLREPQIQMHFLVKALGMLADAQRQIISLGQQDVVRRLATLLSEFSRHESCYDHTTKTLALPIGRPDIADHLGTSTESVARAFRRL